MVCSWVAASEPIVLVREPPVLLTNLDRRIHLLLNHYRCLLNETVVGFFQIPSLSACIRKVRLVCVFPMVY